MKVNKTISQKEITEKWFLVDATGGRIGRISSIVAELLMGKNNPKARTNLDPKCYVVVINSSKIDMPLKRVATKYYQNYSGYPGGLRVTKMEDQFKKNDRYIIEHAVHGMLPKTKMGRVYQSRLKVFSNASHVHEGQKPEVIDIKSFKL